MPTVAVTLSATSEGKWSDPLPITPGRFDFVLHGTWTATVTVQKTTENVTVPSSSSYRYVDEFTTNTDQYGTEAGGYVQYRFGILAGDFSTGTVQGRMSQWN